jgi:hypothetical protein
LPVQAPNKFELVINLKTEADIARALVALQLAQRRPEYVQSPRPCRSASVRPQALRGEALRHKGGQGAPMPIFPKYFYVLGMFGILYFER